MRHAAPGHRPPAARTPPRHARPGSRAPGLARRRLLITALGLVAAAGIGVVAGEPGAGAGAAVSAAPPVRSSTTHAAAAAAPVGGPDGPAEPLLALQPRPGAPARPAALPETAVFPTSGPVTSHFGPRWGRLHAGLDVGAPSGTPVVSVADGTVLEAGETGDAYGRRVTVQHGSGDVTLYGHVSEVLVLPGDVVRAGQEIALVGSAGRSTGPHLHLEVRVGGPDGEKTDPVPWLTDRGAVVPPDA